MRTIHFERDACQHCKSNIYRFVVETEDGLRVIDADPSTTVSELQNRL